MDVKMLGLVIGVCEGWDLSGDAAYTFYDYKSDGLFGFPDTADFVTIEFNDGTIEFCDYVSQDTNANGYYDVTTRTFKFQQSMDYLMITEIKE